MGCELVVAADLLRIVDEPAGKDPALKGNGSLESEDELLLSPADSARLFKCSRPIASHCVSTTCLVAARWLDDHCSRCSMSQSSHP
jgi:hypothetical protein